MKIMVMKKNKNVAASTKANIKKVAKKKKSTKLSQAIQSKIEAGLAEQGFSLYGEPLVDHLGYDDIDVNISIYDEEDSNNFHWKYGEEELLDQLKAYIKTTYGQHYANKKTGTQVLDMYESIGIAIPSCQANAIKYLCRYGKKNGEERKDLMKSLHYIILLIHFIELQNQEIIEDNEVE